MIDLVRSRVARYLAEHTVAIISTAGQNGAWAMRVQYHANDLLVDCLLPCWADALYHLEADPRVTLVVAPQEGGVWLQYCGKAEILAAPDWSNWVGEMASARGLAELYRVVRVGAKRIDLFDDSRGWGVRETLDL